MAKKKGQQKWSGKVTRESHALDLESQVFTKSPTEMAKSLKHSAEVSHSRKSSPFQSAMSMLNFYINRAGRNLSKQNQVRLERAKTELRRIFGRPEPVKIRNRKSSQGIRRAAEFDISKHEFRSSALDAKT